jgi:magnesium transporter
VGADLIAVAGRPPAPADPDEIRRLLADGTPFWLDLHGVGPGESALLRDLFGFHPLAVEDAEHFGQRPKVEGYDDFAFVVAFGAAPDDDGLVEVHLFHSPRFLVSVHREPCPPLEALHAEWAVRRPDADATVMLLHRIIDALTDSFFPALDAFDDALDEFEAGIDEGRTDGQKETIYGLRRRLATLRRVIQPQRDLLARLSSGSAGLPGSSPEAERRFRDVYDHLIRLGEQLETYRELLVGANEMYQSAVSQRANQVLKQLTIISTVFLPLSFLVGFFGQNFTWMVDNIDTRTDFLVLGIGGLIASLALLLHVFRARHWL